MVKASIRKPVTKAPLGKPAPVIDVPANGVDEDSAEKLADALEAGAPVPGSDEEAQAEMEGSSNRVTTAVAARPAQSLGTCNQESEGGLEGDFDTSDLKLPQLKIVNGSGELSQKYNQGSLIYADELLWTPPDLREGAKNPILRFVPVKVQKQYRENLTPEEVAEGLMPRIANSRAEAEAMGGTTEWINNEKPRWSPSARCILLLEEYEGCEHPGFSNPLDGKNYALAVYYSSGVAYSESAKVIFNAAKLSLREKGAIVLHSRVWTWQVTKKKAGPYMVFVPNLKLTKDVTGPELREMVNTIKGHNTTDGE